MFSGLTIPRPRARWRGLVFLAAALFVACSSGSTNRGVTSAGVGAAASSAAGSPVAGAIQGADCGGAAAGAHDDVLITRDQSLYRRDIRTGKDTKLFTAPAGEFVTYPTWSPNGRCFAFALDNAFQGNTAVDWGSDLYVADANGGNQTLIVKHERPGAELESPSWTPDGRAIIYSYFLTMYDDKGQYQGQVYEARRLDLLAHSETQLLKNANGTELCRDGTKLTYVNFDDTDFTSFGIWVADATGQNGKVIVSSSTDLQAFYAPRFSPDCTRIIFAAVGGGLRELPGRSPGPGNLLARLLAPFRPAAAAAHGPPWDLWSVASDGSDLKRVTHVAEDLPFAEWSADGKSVLFLGTVALYEMAPDGSNIKKIGLGAVHGQISWRQR